MSVLKNNRGLSDLEFYHTAISLRKEITKKLLSDFGVKDPNNSKASNFQDNELRSKVSQDKLTDTGRIVVKLCKDSIVRERRKLHKLKPKFDRGEISF